MTLNLKGDRSFERETEQCPSATRGDRTEKR
jgi:hypothetical protein